MDERQEIQQTLQHHEKGGCMDSCTWQAKQRQIEQTYNVFSAVVCMLGALTCSFFVSCVFGLRTSCLQESRQHMSSNGSQVFCTFRPPPPFACLFVFGCSQFHFIALAFACSAGATACRFLSSATMNLASMLLHWLTVPETLMPSC